MVCVAVVSLVAFSHAGHTSVALGELVSAPELLTTSAEPVALRPIRPRQPDAVNYREVCMSVERKDEIS